MECNKDDAIKAKELAERKLIAKDVVGAKKLALKAQALFPELEGISQLLSTLHVYESGENKIYGESDWYGILDVKPPADDDIIRKHYRKLALMLHPDKNKSVGAEGAFKFVSEAWSLLSDKNKRATYDVKRNSKCFLPENKPPPPECPSNAKGNKNSSHANGYSSGSTCKTNNGSFWTVCLGCRMRYEYMISYLNHNLVCGNCHKPFLAIETKAPALNGCKFSKPWNSGPQYSPVLRNKNGSNVRPNSSNFQWSPFSGDARASSVAQATNVVQQTYRKVKRVHEEAQAAGKRKKTAKRKKYGSENMAGSSAEKKRRVNKGINNKQMAPGTRTGKDHNMNSIQTTSTSRFNSNRELTQMEVRNVLMFKARKDISKKVSEWSSACMVDDDAQKEKGIGQDKTVNVEVHCDTHDTGHCKKSLQNTTVFDATKEFLDRPPISVPDPDFYGFDKDRTEIVFVENQVWAVYDNDDGMPRYYAMINSVISRDPFRVRISWLNSETNTDLGCVNWAKTCGDFGQGRHETCKSLNCYSHKVRWTKGNRGVIQIFPRKGDVWALYRKWSPNWEDEFSLDEKRCKYEMVEVVDDYDEELGVVVIPLVKVAGFKGVFHQHLDPKQARRIPKEEILQFSYQAPSHLISGQEAPNDLKGCRELDPAALPF